MEIFVAFWVLAAFAIGIGFFVIWVWAFIQVLQRGDEAGYQTGSQLIWILILIFLGPLGAIVYYFMEHKARAA